MKSMPYVGCKSIKEIIQSQRDCPLTIETYRRLLKTVIITNAARLVLHRSMVPRLREHLAIIWYHVENLSPIVDFSVELQINLKVLKQPAWYKVS